MRSTCILVVHADASTRLCITRMLRADGYFVLETCDNETALNMLRLSTLDLDILVTDERLASLSSINPTKLVRRVRPIMPILVVCEELDGGFKGTDQGIAVLQKPLKYGTLSRVIRELLSEVEGLSSAAGVRTASA